ncbi:hypothetical protein GC167_08725 [bacterium]|nr:hypothetical protein [bacterium]
MTDFFRQHKTSLLGASIGAVAGWLYFRYVGCASGSCSITSDPLKSALMGALLGWIGLSSDAKPETKQP